MPTLALFDMTVTGLYGSLISGGCVYLAPIDEELRAQTPPEGFAFLGHPQPPGPLRLFPRIA